MQRSCGRKEHSTFEEMKDQHSWRAMVQIETGLLSRVPMMFSLTGQLWNLAFNTKSNAKPLRS